jgi:hypothetical protein
MHKQQPTSHTRSPLLIAAYLTLGGGLIFLMLGAGAFWILGSMSMAVLLALGDLYLKIRRS